MTKRLFIFPLLALSLCLALIMACQRQAPQKATLAVSIEPQRYLLERIVGSKYNIVTLLTANSDPETYDPSVSNLLALQKCDIYFRVGTIGFEQATLEKISENYPTLEIINSSKGISRAEGTHGGPHGYDPHVWTSVKNARIMAKNMYNALVIKYPKNKNLFTRQWSVLDRDLKMLDSLITEQLKPYSGKAFIIKHPSLTYFARDYNLKQIPLEINCKEPSPNDMKQRMNEINIAKPVVFFIEPGRASDTQRALANELKIPVAEISPLEHDWKKNIITVANAIANQNSDSIK